MIRFPASRETALWVVFLLACQFVLAPANWAAPDPPWSSPADSSRVILDRIGALEAESDAKCNSTASRFEDFLFGTPLSEAARLEKNRLQKALVRKLWFPASDAALAAGEAAVTAGRIEAEAASLLSVSDEPGGALKILFPGQAPLEISARRSEQYGSIAYSLRAILAVEQENLLSVADPPLALTPKATRVLQRKLDLVFLSALLRADEAARMENAHEIGAGMLADAWSALIPPGKEAALTFALSENPEGAARDRGLLDELITKKIEAYRVYNELGERKARALFITNTVRFYARAKIPRNADARTGIIGAVNRDLDAFSQALLAEASREAEKRGHALIRADDAGAATHALLPQQIDVFEDVWVFPNFSGPETVVLEAYDCDSFRDFGFHWQSLRRALDARPQSAPSLDPFAAEILAETISQYGVLLLRVAGEKANARPENLMLTPADLVASAKEISARAQRHPAAARERASGSEVVSAPASPGGASPDAFFTDVTQAAGLSFQHRSSRWLGEFRHKQVRTPPTFSGGGVAAEDIDGDGSMDVLLVGGAGNALLLNDGSGGFLDMTVEAGLDYQRPDGSRSEPRKPIVADFDNDGLQDILITHANDDHRLFRNIGGRRFEDVSAKAGLGGADLIGGPATAFDFDGDGLLDLYLGYFGNYLEGDFPAQDRDNHEALPNRLFRNLGSMRFEDVTEESGTGDRGWTQAVSHLDFDGDGRQDLVVANDYGRNAFLRNLGGGRFRDVAPEFGMDKALHSMNVGVTDINLDGYPDVYISNIATLVKDDKYMFPDVNTPLNFDLRAMSGMLVKEADTFFVSETEAGGFKGYALSTDVERGATSTGWAWDAEFLDFDHDGDDDLYLVNGTNDYNAFSMIVANRQAGENAGSLLLSHSRESNVFFLNEGGKLKNRSAESGADFVGNSRSTAYFDFDEDGDLDIVVNNFHAPATLLRNNSEERGRHWLKVKLEGDPEQGSSRDAIGAWIHVSADGGLRNSRLVQGGSGYLSTNPKQQHLGVGTARRVDIRVVWPGGQEQVFKDLAVDRAYTISQASGLRGRAVASEP